MWSKILGHSRQILKLKRALKENKVPHAYLFSGIEGVGKRQTAIGLAQALNCAGIKEIPCEQCLSCQKISKGVHPDCLFIEPDGKTIRIEVLRDLKQKAYLYPLEGRSKIFIIDQAEKMTLASANALLKILEEPPNQTYFILITSQPSALLPTIRSRCQKMEFGPLPSEILIQILMRLGKDSKEAKLLADLSQGSIQKAFEFDLALFEETKTKWKELQEDPRPTHIIALSETWSEEEEKLSQILNTLSLLVHEKILNTEDPKELERQTDRWFAIQNAQRGLETYVNKRLLVEDLLFRLA